MITDRILDRLGDAGLLEKIRALPKSDFNSLLLRLFHMQSDGLKPANIVKAFHSNRFTTPSEVDAAAYHAFETELLTLAKDNGIETVLLSPVVPFGSSSAFGCVDQNNVVSAARGSEVLSDPTNMLAIIIANRLKANKSANINPLHYCTTARVLRAQVFPSRKGYYSHFGIFCIVSSGKDTGSYACERSLFIGQLRYYRKLLLFKYGANLSVVIRKRRGYTDGDGFYESMVKTLGDELPGIPISLDPEYEENNYYRGAHFQIYMENKIVKNGDAGNYDAATNELIEVGDGGFVDWMTQMTGNKKERCLISGIGLDRLLI